MRIVAALALVVAVTLVQGSLDTSIIKALNGAVKDSFTRLDINKDGLFKQDEVKKEMQRLDANGDNRVTWDEFKVDLHTFPEEVTSKFANSSLVQQYKEDLFRCLAKNQDFIPADVTRQYLQPWFDTDSDGDITLEEYANLRMKIFLESMKGTNKCPFDPV